MTAVTIHVTIEQARAMYHALDTYSRHHTLQHWRGSQGEVA